MRMQRFVVLCLVMLLVGFGGALAWAATSLTPPPESLNGLRPGTLTVGQITARLGDPAVTDNGSMLELYGGTAESTVYGWFLIENPNYTIPDLAVETARGSDKVELVMSIGYDGLKTEKGVACFDSEKDIVAAYGKPDFVFAVPMEGYTLREFYYLDQGLSFDVAPVGQNSERQVIAIYVTYPEYMRRAVDLRRQYIKEGVGKDITTTFQASGLSV